MDEEAIILTDLRKEIAVFAADIFFKRKVQGKSCQVFMAESVLTKHDYGFPVESVRRESLRFLARLFKIHVLPEQTFEQAKLPSICRNAVLSSLISLTMDSLADCEQYPDLYKSLAANAFNAYELARNLKNQGVKQVFVFNGRTASSAPFYEWFGRDCIDIYEYSLTYFYRSGISPFDHSKLCKLMPELWEIKRKLLSPQDLRDAISVFARERLGNSYAREFDSSAVQPSDVVIFLSSPHEHKAMKLLGVVSPYENDLEYLIDASRETGGGSRVVLRCHPNSRRDRSWKAVSRDALEFATELGWSVVGPESNVNSYALIQATGLVVVDYSSIAIDSILLGKCVNIKGFPDYKNIILAANERLLKGNFSEATEELLAIYYFWMLISIKPDEQLAKYAWPNIDLHLVQKRFVV